MEEIKKVVVPFTTLGLGLTHFPVKEENYRPGFPDDNNWPSKPKENTSESEEDDEHDDIKFGHAGGLFLAIPGEGMSFGQIMFGLGFILISIIILTWLFKRHARKRKINKFLDAKNIELAVEDEDLGVC